MSEYDYLNYKFDTFMYSLQTDINVGMARDSRSILDRVAHGAEVTHDKFLQFSRWVYSGARRAMTLMSCRTVQELAPSTHTERPARPAGVPSTLR